jgi:hypothetical protein
MKKPEKKITNRWLEIADARLTKINPQANVVLLVIECISSDIRLKLQDDQLSELFATMSADLGYRPLEKGSLPLKYSVFNTKDYSKDGTPPSVRTVKQMIRKALQMIYKENKGLY